MPNIESTPEKAADKIKDNNQTGQDGPTVDNPTDQVGPTVDNQSGQVGPTFDNQTSGMSTEFAFMSLSADVNQDTAGRLRQRPTIPGINAGQVSSSRLTQNNFCDFRLDDEGAAEFDQADFMLDELPVSDFRGSGSSSDACFKRGFTSPRRPVMRTTSQRIRDIELEYEEDQQRKLAEQKQAKIEMQLVKELGQEKVGESEEESADLLTSSKHEPLLSVQKSESCEISAHAKGPSAKAAGGVVLDSAVLTKVPEKSQEEDIPEEPTSTPGDNEPMTKISEKKIPTVLRGPGRR